jgi:hypothetical protein
MPRQDTYTPFSPILMTKVQLADLTESNCNTLLLYNDKEYNIEQQNLKC